MQAASAYPSGRKFHPHITGTLVDCNDRIKVTNQPGQV
jgi:hypothetical protein